MDHEQLVNTQDDCVQIVIGSIECIIRHFHRAMYTLRPYFSVCFKLDQPVADDVQVDAWLIDSPLQLAHQDEATIWLDTKRSSVQIEQLLILARIFGERLANATNFSATHNAETSPYA